MQSKTINLYIELLSGEIERSSSMKQLLVQSIKDIIELPFKGDPKIFLQKTLRIFESKNLNIELLDLINIFLDDFAAKKDPKFFAFSNQYDFLENFDLLRIFYEFLMMSGTRIVQNGEYLDLYFKILEKLIIKQKKFDKLNNFYLLKMWKVIFANQFLLLKDKFTSFLVRNYFKIFKRFNLFPYYFSSSMIKTITNLKSYYKKFDSQIRHLPESQTNINIAPPSQNELPDISIIEADPSNNEDSMISPLDQEEQLLFKILFLIENSVGKNPKIKLLSEKLSDELFILLEDIDMCKGFKELWYICKNVQQVDDLHEFLIKLIRYQGYNHMIFYFNDDTDMLNLTKLDEKKLNDKEKKIVTKYKLNDVPKKKIENSSIDHPSMYLFEKSLFNFCNQIINNLKYGIENDNDIIIKNMLLLFRNVFFTFNGFLGECDRFFDNKSTLSNQM